MSSFRPILLAIISLFTIICLGTFSFMKLENLNLVDSLWLTVITMSTVGFGDIVPVTPVGRLIALFLIISGVWLFTYVLSNIFSGLLEGQLRDLWGKQKMKQKVANLKNHIVVCGAGRVGSEVITELKREHIPFVVIEKDAARQEELQEAKVLHIIGDATEDKILQTARLEHASGVIITLPEDTGNLFITMTCKNLVPNIRIVVRANRPENIRKMQRAGADNVICPAAIAGNRMALAVTKPSSVAYVQTLVENREINLELEELVLSANSDLANLELKDSGLREKFAVQLLAIKRGNKTLLNPSACEKILPEDVLIVCGPAEGLAELERIASNYSGQGII